MTTKKVIKATKAAAAYIATKAHIALATTCGEAALTAGSARERASEAAAKLHEAKAVVGKIGECPLAIAFLAARFPGGKNAKGKKITPRSQEQILSRFRLAVKTGKPYNENKADETGARKGKKTGAKQSGGAIMIAISPADTASKAAEKLRKGFEKMRAANDGLAALAAFLVDALDEAAAE